MEIDNEIEIKTQITDGFLIWIDLCSVQKKKVLLVATLIIVKLPFTVYIASISFF